MPLWGSKDDAANSDYAALMQVSKSVTSGNRTILYGNTRPNTFMTSANGNVVVGQFGVDTSEVRAANQSGRGHPPHAGWALRYEGRGLKAGRVWYETLVAMGSMTGDGNSTEDTYFPDYALVISTQPTSNTFATRQNISFSVAASSVPSGATLQYFWQYNNLTGSLGWANVANTAGRYFNNTSPTFTANNTTANGNVFRVMVMTTGANTVYSSNATIYYIV